MAALLALQRSAGNAAVGRMLARVKATSYGGEWNADPYEKWDHEKGLSKGVDIRLEFTPNLNATADRIGLTQSIKAVKGTEQYRPADDDLSAHAQEKRSVTKGPEKDWMIDRMRGNPNPIYGADAIDDTRGKSLGDTTFKQQEEGKSQLFERGRTDKAVVTDTPMRALPLAANARLEFETTAVALDDDKPGRYYGSVVWGWMTDGAGVLSKIPFALKRVGNPSSDFVESAKVWNATSNTPKKGVRQNPASQKYEVQVWMSDDESDKNLQIPMPSPEGPFVLPPKALYKAMKKNAKAKLTPLSGKLPVSDYGKLVAAYNGHTANERWDKADGTLTKLKVALDKLDSATGYWKSATLKAQYFTPILKAVEGHQALIAQKLRG